MRGWVQLALLKAFVLMRLGTIDLQEKRKI